MTHNYLAEEQENVDVEGRGLRRSKLYTKEGGVLYSVRITFTSTMAVTKYQQTSCLDVQSI